MSDGSMLILCTDGIWNVAPEPERMAELARRPSAGAAGLARDLVQYAIALGSRDDVSAAVSYKESPS
jgi:serine/threonine protein phosphatase PrpC